MKSLKTVLTGLLSDSEGHSMIRLMSLMSLVVGSGIGIYGVIRGKDLSGVAQIVGVFVVSAFAGKAAQKVMEK